MGEYGAADPFYRRARESTRSLGLFALPNPPAGGRPHGPCRYSRPGLTHPSPRTVRMVMVDDTVPIDAHGAALVLVDVQPDFLPGGRLPVAGGDAILGPLRDLLEGELFPLCVATQDWHPPGHVSFASSHQGREPMETIELYGHSQVLWPDHCVQGSAGAELHPELPWNHVSAIVRKGVDMRVDSYSGFRNNWDPEGRRPPTGLAGYLSEREVGEVFLCGLARDVCVKWTAEDAVAAGFRTYVLWDLTRSVDPQADEAVRRELEAAGVSLIGSDSLVAPATGRGPRGSSRGSAPGSREGRR